MTRLRKRKIKSLVVDLIAYTLSIILLAILMFSGIGIAYLVALSLTYEAVRIGLIVIGIVGAFIMMFIEFREE